MTDRVDAKAVLKAMRNSAFCPEPWAYTLAHLLADLEDWERASKKVMSEQCPPDERHCTCVPFIRKRLEAAEKILAKHGCTWVDGDYCWNTDAALAGEKP